MWRATLSSIASHKLRLFSTALAIIVGVAFVTGTLILSDTLRGTFDELFGQANDAIDVAVQGPENGTDPFTGETLHNPVAEDLIGQIESLDDVAVVSPEVSGTAQLIDPDGEPVGGFGPPTIGFSAPTSDLLDTPKLREGRFPTQAGEVALDVATAESQVVGVGDTVQIVVDGPVQSFTVTGLVGFGDLDSMAGATIVVFEPAQAFEFYGSDEGFDILYVVAADGVGNGQLRDEVAQVVPADFEVQTGAQLSEGQSTEIADGLGFFTTALLVFAGVALFVGAFLIANTFSIILAQRTRELALLRAVGASRRQILASVLGEAFATGLIGSLVGFGVGVALASGLYALLDAFGISLPQGDLVVTAGTFTVAVVLGVVLTTVVAVFPAVRSTRVPPVAALQAVAAPPPPSRGVVRYSFGAVLFLAGVAGLALSITNGTGLSAVGAAAVLTLIGAAVLAPLVTRPLLVALGAPLSASRGIQGQLATENALRSPRRTAATASALMIGLALVSFVAIMAASFTKSVETTIADSFTGDFQIASQGFIPGQTDPGPALVEEVRAVDGVDVATTQSFAIAQYEGDDVFLSGYDADVIDRVLSVTVIDGAQDRLLDTGLAIGKDVADAQDLAVGSPVELTFPDAEPAELTVGAVFESNPLAGNWVVAQDVVDGDTLVFGTLIVELSDGTDASTVRPRIEQVLEAYPTLELQDLTQVQDSITSQINQLLGLMSALLGLSVIVALFGIVNTLGLSVFERTRELGLLRAIGASRAQVRSMIRWESVLIALLGAVFGLIIGVLFAWILVLAIGEDQNLILAVPAGQLVAGLLAAAIAGVVAAIIPARRASRIDILRSLEAT